jgi:hypothetical protein
MARSASTVSRSLCCSTETRDVGDGVESPHLRAVPSPTESDLAGYVARLPYQRLVELVLAQVESDWRLRERLAAEARVARGDGPELDPWHRRIDVAFAPYDYFVDYRDAAGRSSDVDDVIDALEELCDAVTPTRWPC